MAARLHYSIPLSELDGWLFLAAPGNSAGKLMTTNRHGRAEKGTLHANLEMEIIAKRIDLLVMDPFVKAHAVAENDNNSMDHVVQLLTDLAAKLNIAVDVPHHISKGIADPGNANRGRGASSMVDAGRLIYTAATMQTEEASAFGISEELCKEYFRVDHGKVNITRGSKPASWFHLVGVQLGNATEIYPSGDKVLA